jgi:hypothetical protein
MRSFLCQIRKEGFPQKSRTKAVFPLPCRSSKTRKVPSDLYEGAKEASQRIPYPREAVQKVREQAEYGREQLEHTREAAARKAREAAQRAGETVQQTGEAIKPSTS